MSSVRSRGARVADEEERSEALLRSKVGEREFRCSRSCLQFIIPSLAVLFLVAVGVLFALVVQAVSDGSWWLSSVLPGWSAPVASSLLSFSPLSSSPPSSPSGRGSPARSFSAPEACQGCGLHSSSASFDALFPSLSVRVIGSGFNWSEGPLFLASASSPDQDVLLLSDPIQNRLYRYVRGSGLSVLKESVYLGPIARSEPGSNGLALDPSSESVFVCEHGNRRISKLVGLSSLVPVVETFRGRRFNSPNDLVFAPLPERRLYFTDPIYGLPQRSLRDPLADLSFEGVFLFNAQTYEVRLLRELEHPNGLGLSPDGRWLYVSSSSKDRPCWYRFGRLEDGSLDEGSVFLDGRPLQEAPWGQGSLPDGLVVDGAGRLLASGPGGLHVIAPNGTVLGTVSFPEKVSNVAFGRLWPDGSRELFVTGETSLYSLTLLPSE